MKTSSLMFVGKLVFGVELTGIEPVTSTMRTALEAPLGHPGPAGRFFPSIIRAENSPKTIRIFYTAIQFL